ncbi:unnamed protein product [Prorocentrum cordatum]|uniref:Fatty acid hydroxylase domain-containing protein n=1 Tax=Prorocentrum cordatum TaxID=2364126 RepID=A0ABN9VMX2_9DINO|nr:unnamed protein product [Polarella glacialis]
MHGTINGAVGFAAFCAAWLMLELQRGKGLGEALRSWWLEPAVATLSFAVAIAIFDKRERDMGLGEEGRISTLRPGPDFVAPGSVNMLFVAGVLYWAGICVWVRLVPAVEDIPDGWPDGFQGAVYLICEVCAGIWAYDFIFSFVHLAAHHLGWDSHQYHHLKKLDIRARDVLTHSPSDGALQVLVNIIVQRHTPWGGAKSRLARIVHNVVVTWMLTESHSASPSPNVARRRREAPDGHSFEVNSRGMEFKRLVALATGSSRARRSTS